jgi:glycosyltransferase involved in cell wall biosynthesis
MLTRDGNRASVVDGASDHAVAPRDGMPYLHDVGVVALVPDRWGGHWQLRHQILTRLARYVHVVWCDPPRGWRETWRGGVSSTPENGPLAPNFHVYRPGKALPRFYRPSPLATFTARQRLRQARRLLIERGVRKVILYIWRPEYGAALDLVDHDVSCYHIDDEYSFSPVEQPIDPAEAQLISRVDQVFIHSLALLEKKGHLNPHTLRVPNGVDYARYVRAVPPPADLAAIPRPRIGYVGFLQSTVNFELLLALAHAHTRWSFVMVGPRGHLGADAPLVEHLARLGNVHMLGGKPVDELPAYTQHLDVCLLCYKVNDYTKFIYPLKLHEYLASGRPAVGAPIRSLREVDGVIRLASSPEEWSRAIADSLQPEVMAPLRVDERRRVARRHDWNVLTANVATALCARLGEPYAGRLERLMDTVDGRAR